MRASYDDEAGSLSADDVWRQRLSLDLDGIAEADGLQDPNKSKKRKRRKSHHGKAKSGIRKVRTCTVLRRSRTTLLDCSWHLPAYLRPRGLRLM